MELIAYSKLWLVFHIVCRFVLPYDDVVEYQGFTGPSGLHLQGEDGDWCFQGVKTYITPHRAHKTLILVDICIFICFVVFLQLKYFLYTDLSFFAGHSFLIPVLDSSFSCFFIHKWIFTLFRMYCASLGVCVSVLYVLDLLPMFH